jgi:subtilisin family serine protease
VQEAQLLPLFDPDGTRPQPVDEAAYIVRAEPTDLDRISHDLGTAGAATRFARMIRNDSPKRPFGLTGEVVAVFDSSLDDSAVEDLAAEFGFIVIERLEYLQNAFLLQFRTGPDYAVLAAMGSLAARTDVATVEPNLLFFADVDGSPEVPVFARVNHVPYREMIGVDVAGDLLELNGVNRGGDPGIIIAVVDPEGVTTVHPSLTAALSDNQTKMVTNLDFTLGSPQPQQQALLVHDHGTQCAGSAVGADIGRGAPGVAPNCRLVAVRCGAVTDEVLLGRTYRWLGGLLPVPPGWPAPVASADIISSSYGRNRIALGAPVRTAFDNLTTAGRSTKGTLLLWATGNPGHVDFTASGENYRSWATYHRCLAIGASIGPNPTNPVPSSQHEDPVTGTSTDIPVRADRRSLSSPYGRSDVRKPDLVCPSDTTIAQDGTSVDPIVSCTFVGQGTIDGDYAAKFGGTSHATPAVAGALALLLSAQPDLTWTEARDILLRSCVRIDASTTHGVGQWQDLDGDGAPDFSRWYGAGRINIGAAVALVLNGG